MKKFFPVVVMVMFASLILLPQIARAQDADADGMPDAYEAIHVCLQPGTPDGNVDYDADGMTSLQE